MKAFLGNALFYSYTTDKLTQQEYMTVKFGNILSHEVPPSLPLITGVLSPKSYN